MIELLSFTDRFYPDDLRGGVLFSVGDELFFGLRLAKVTPEAIHHHHAGTFGQGSTDGDREIVTVVVVLFIRRRGVIDAHDDGPFWVDHFVGIGGEPSSSEVDPGGSFEVEEEHPGEFDLSGQLADVVYFG